MKGAPWRHMVVERTPQCVQNAVGPAASMLDMLIIDHGALRAVYLNRHRLGPKAWRSAQPAPHQIRSLARSGIKTIINLRGPRLCGSYVLERQACREAGITLIDCHLRSRVPPSRERLLELIQHMTRTEGPLLIHCKSGADRTGFASVLYRHIVMKEPLEAARQQLSWKFGHLRQTRAGVLDFIFEAYAQHVRTSNGNFQDWARTHYEPADVLARYEQSRK